SVDFPTPGSPPSNTSAPATTPPPKTRSNSATPVEIRGVSVADDICSNKTGVESQDGGAAAAGAVIFSSTNVFHSWQVGQRPIHLGEVWPHCWQAYWVFDFISGMDKPRIERTKRIEFVKFVQFVANPIS